MCVIILKFYTWVDTHFISVGRDVQMKGVLFSVWNGGLFHQRKFGKGFEHICLERVHACLVRGRNIFKIKRAK